jgi:DNA (cytosine-5)-methyltransferase 1
MLFNGQGRPINLDNVANTLPASMGGNRTPIIDEELLRNPKATSWISKYHAHRQSGRKKKWEVPSHIRRITVTEAALLQGFPIDYCFLGNQCTQYRLIGNAVPPPLAEAVAQAVNLCVLGFSR